MTVDATCEATDFGMPSRPNDWTMFVRFSSEPTHARFQKRVRGRVVYVRIGSHEREHDKR